MYVFFGVVPLLTHPMLWYGAKCQRQQRKWVVGGGGWGEADIFTPGDPAGRVSLKWRRSIELRGHRAKGGDADGDVERYASEAPSSAQPLLRVCLSLSVGKVFSFLFTYLFIIHFLSLSQGIRLLPFGTKCDSVYID